MRRAAAHDRGSDEACSGETPICAPGTDVGGLLCTAIGSLPNGSLCEPGDSAACVSRICSTVEFMGTPTNLYACGECSTDADCPESSACSPGTIEDGVVGAICETDEQERP